MTTFSDDAATGQARVDARQVPRRTDEIGLRSLLELSCDWYWVLDAQLHLVRLESGRVDPKTSYQVPFGKPPWEWPGVQVDRADFAKLRAAMVERRQFFELEYTLRDHRGQLRYLCISGEPVFDCLGAFAGYQGTTRELTKHKRVEALVALEHAVTRSIAEAANSRKILQAVMRVICESERWETAGYFRVEDPQGTTRLIAGWSGPGMADAAIDYYKNTTDKVIPPGGLLSQVAATGKALWVDDMKESQTTWSQRVERTGERATFFCPVLVDAQVIGVFAFTTREIREPDERLLQTMQVIGEQVGQFLKRKQAEQVLRESEARFRALTDLSSDWYWEIDADFRLTRIEGHHVGAGESLPGKNSIGRAHWEMGLEVEDAAGWGAHRASLENHVPFRDVVMTHERLEGTRRYINVSGEPIYSQQGAFVGYRGVGRDISERKLAENRILHLGTHDGLTGLPNRVLFGELLGVAIRATRPNGLTLAVLFIDLDRFKIVNDTLGHDAGDTLLKEMARRLKGCLRPGDVVARLGGDEFVVLLPQLEDIDDVGVVARKILAATARPALLQGREYRVTASVGVSVYGADAPDELTLMRNADVAMYVAKQNGKNGFQLYSPEIALQSSHRQALEDQLRGALERNEFHVHYQAKVDLASRAIVGVEALLRWNSPELGRVPPLQFIPLAEETGLILPIGKWVLRQACMQGMAWRRLGLPPLTMAVNLSSSQFSDEFLLGDVAGVLRESGMPPELLELELTEGMVIQNVDRATKLLQAIKGMGVRLAIDDFGTGYSSLGQLKNFPIDTLKIDRSFIRDLASNVEDKALTEAIIAMGKALGLTVVAEGVETQQQEDFLRKHGCDQMQGFHFSKPVCADEFVDLWRRHEASASARKRAQEPAGTCTRGRAAAADPWPHPVAADPFDSADRSNLATAPAPNVRGTGSGPPRAGIPH